MAFKELAFLPKQASLTLGPEQLVLHTGSQHSPRLRAAGLEVSLLGRQAEPRAMVGNPVHRVSAEGAPGASMHPDIESEALAVLQRGGAHPTSLTERPEHRTPEESG